MTVETSDNQPKSNLLLWITLGLLLAAFTLVAIYKAWPILFPQISQSAAVDPNCDLRKAPCVSSINHEVAVGFSIEPREIPLLKPLKLTVEIAGVAVERVEVDFAGVDMNMGYNRVVLQPVTEGQFEGEGMIPVCVMDSMEWEAKVLITTKQGLLSAPYRFVTVRPGLTLP
ncbi:MAG: hypothetical protein N0C83_08300 [Candidatus Thiodiazotropha lotti]|nr:hypothetical protein [Candidatus Thiodiazotropha lotti]MCG7932409.1 hypothetical protein [Candidatus Thiodiazotropha lotti]MCG7989860.1 hypothetical protein [Candidatus Thiodiazotropha lotti]MCG8002281.1 hypothetical protein [Candidatus Thiodiazotropha lotti]MCG8013052.1 hypothetical protein [Candidatus Thiodiazotropha lotti]